MIKNLEQAKRFLKKLFGFTVLFLGVIMLVTPGPGWVVILFGLGILAAEYVWARRLLDRLKEQGGRIRDSIFPRDKAPVPAPAPSLSAAASVAAATVPAPQKPADIPASESPETVISSNH